MNIFKTCFSVILLMLAMTSQAQEKKVQNRPYTDLRPFHFGIQVGTHFQDMDFTNIGPQTLTTEDGTVLQKTITTDQDRWDPGFNVGVIGEFRLTENFQFRIAPAIYFGARHLVFREARPNDDDLYIETTQDLKSAFITSTFDLIFAAPRLNNHRTYVMAGITPALNLTGKKTDLVYPKRFQTYAEVGLGIDYYLPYFKCRPELKFMFGLGNSLDSNHIESMKDPNAIMFARSVSSARSRMITLIFFFE